MEVKINKEIREYTEKIYFGLSLRQFIFSLLSCVVAVVLYFMLKPYFNMETLSWLCILGAFPFAVMGYVKYNGMNAEEFIKTYIESKILTKRELTFKSKNFYYELVKEKKDENNK